MYGDAGDITSPLSPGDVGDVTFRTSPTALSPDWLAYCVSRTCGSALSIGCSLSRWVAAGHDLGRVVTRTPTTTASET